MENLNTTPLPRIGDKAPSFEAVTTQGPIRFPEDYAGRWIILFSHPSDFTPVCTSEFMTFAARSDEFEALNCQLVGLSVEAGYTGGRTDRPTYEEVCSHTTGHAEAVRVTFDTSKVSYETLARLFFEIHDPTQIDRQGPDIGDQYRSEIFYTSPEQRAVAERLIALLRSKGYRVATRVTPAGPFWPAETCHQDYYRRRGTLPYCHAYTRRF